MGVLNILEDFMDIQWLDNVDTALARAKSEKKLLLLDFTAAPM